MSDVQRRYAKCVVCESEGTVVNKMYSQKQISEQGIDYSGAYVFNRICTDCQNKYIHNHPEIKVDWTEE